MWSNFHMHSNYCDGKAEMIDYVQEAKAKGMLSIGFSSHAPVNFPCLWCMKSEKFSSYLQSIDALKASASDIEVYKGLEVDFIPGVISPDNFRKDLDYTIGSIHFVDRYSDGRPWEIDGMHTLFLDGLEKIFQNDIKAVVSRYFELTREMIDTSCPTIVGHLDKIKIQNPAQKFFSEDEEWYQKEVKKTIDLIAEKKVIVEVNTRGIYQKKSSTTYPSPWILELMKAKNVPITISSDAHHPSDIINQFPETAALLMDIGYNFVNVLHKNKWKAFSFNKHGIQR
ncbi:MAG TPA: histidinol-phosphatase [Chryseolinea sp.]|nr:histidinol-phosphatase [Chryseolinea sp.]